MRVAVLTLLLTSFYIITYGQKFALDSQFYKNYCLKFLETYPQSNESIFAWYFLEVAYVQENDKTKLSNTYLELMRKPHNQQQILQQKIPNAYHHICDTLSKIYQAKKMYDSALYYLFLMDTVYKYKGSCFDDQLCKGIIMACRFATLYQKLNKPDLAEQALLKIALIRGADIQIKKLKTIYETVNKEQLKTDLNKAIEKYQVLSEEKGHYYISFRNTKVQFGLTSDEISLLPAEKRLLILAKLKKSELYKMVMTL